MPETITVMGEGLSLDLILWRKHGVRGRALVEAALAMNPGLAGLGPILPLGAQFVLPDLPAETAREVAVISLFD